MISKPLIASLAQDSLSKNSIVKLFREYQVDMIYSWNLTNSKFD